MQTILKILSKLLSPKVSLRVDKKEKLGKNSRPDIVGLLTLERFVLLLKQCQGTTQHMTAQQTVSTPIVKLHRNHWSHAANQKRDPAHHSLREQGL